MRVAIGLALAAVLCVGCGGPPEGVCPATSTATQGQLVIRAQGHSSPYTLTQRLECAGDVARIICTDTNAASVSYTLDIAWSTKSLTSVTVFDSRNDGALAFAARGVSGTFLVAEAGGSEIPNRREAVVTAFLCDNAEGPYVGADLKAVRILLPAGL